MPDGIQPGSQDVTELAIGLKLLATEVKQARASEEHEFKRVEATLRELKIAIDKVHHDITGKDGVSNDVAVLKTRMTSAEADIQEAKSAVAAVNSEVRGMAWKTLAAIAVGALAIIGEIVLWLMTNSIK